MTGPEARPAGAGELRQKIFALKDEIDALGARHRGLEAEIVSALAADNAAAIGKAVLFEANLPVLLAGLVRELVGTQEAQALGRKLEATAAADEAEKAYLRERDRAAERPGDADERRAWSERVGKANHGATLARAEARDQADLARDVRRRFEGIEEEIDALEGLGVKTRGPRAGCSPRDFEPFYAISADRDSGMRAPRLGRTGDRFVGRG